MKYTILLFITSVFLFSCRKNKTTWDTDWTIPIINDSLNLSHFVNDSTLKTTVSNSYELDLHRTLMNIDLTDLIKIPDTTINQNFSLSVSNLTISPGTVFVNPSQIEEHTIDLKDIQLKKIRLKQGTIRLKLSNPVGTKTFFTVTLPGVKKNGVDFEHVYEAPAGSIENPGIIEESVDITGSEMDLTGVNGSEFNILKSYIAVKTDPQGPTVNITNQHVTKVEATMKDIKIDYARGYFGNQILSDTSTTFIEALSKLTAGAIDLPATTLKFNISNGLKINAKATLSMIQSENYNHEIVSISHPQKGQPIYLNQATGSWNNFTSSNTTIEFNSTNSNIENYLENLGSKHTFGYSIQLNPWGNVSGGWNEIFPDSKLKVTIDASMPLNIGFNGLTAQDTFDFDLSQNEKKSHITSGNFVLITQNAFPFSAKIKLILLDENNAVKFIIPSSSEITSSLFGNNYTNSGTQYSNSTITFEITEEIIHSISDIKKIAVQATLNSPSPVDNTNQSVIIPENAFIGLKLKAAFKLKAKI